MNPEQPSNLKILADIVCAHFEVPWRLIESKKRGRNGVEAEARHAFVYLAYYLVKKNKSQIARLINRDHTTVIHAINKIEGFKKVGDPLLIDLAQIKNKFLHEIKAN